MRVIEQDFSSGSTWAVASSIRREKVVNRAAVVVYEMYLPTLEPSLLPIVDIHDRLNTLLGSFTCAQLTQNTTRLFQTRFMVDASTTAAIVALVFTVLAFLIAFAQALQQYAATVS